MLPEAVILTQMTKIPQEAVILSSITISYGPAKNIIYCRQRIVFTQNDQNSVTSGRVNSVANVQFINFIFKNLLFFQRMK